VLLDALGTLIELEPPAPALRGELQRRCGVVVDETVAQQAIAAEIGYYRQHLDEGRDADSLAALRRSCADVVRQALAEAGADPVPDPAATTEALLAALRFRRFADVLPALTDLHRRGIRTAVVSNWDVSLHAVLERLGVGQLVHAVLTSAELGVRKPAPEIFALALAALDVSPQQAWHIGDSLEEDVAGARAAGIKPVLIRRGTGKADAALVGADVAQIASLSQLPELLSRRPE
jgi:putative hydrolase of the HAD superfamily